MTRHYDDAALQEFLDGRCAAGDPDAVRAHLDACPSCALRYRGLRVVDRGLRRLPLEHPAPHMTMAVMTRIESKHTRNWLDVALDPRVLSGVVVGAFGAVLAATMGFMATHRSPAPESGGFPHGIADRIGGGIDTAAAFLTRSILPVLGPDALHIAMTLVVVVPLFIIADRFLAMRRMPG